MNLKTLAIATVAGTALLAASAAQADHARGYGYRHHDRHHVRHHRHVPHHVVVRPAPVYYYAPQPVYYYPPQPVYHAPPRPVIYGTIPFGDARVRIGLQF